MPRLAPGQASQCAAQRRRSRIQFALEPYVEGAAINPGRFRLSQFFEGRVDARFHRPLAQDLRAETVDRSDGRFFQPLQRVFQVRTLRVAGARGARFVQFLAQTDLQFAGGFMRESDGHDLLHRSAGRQHPHNALDQFRSLARARRSLHNETLPERSADALPRRRIVSLYAGNHGMFLKSCNAPNSSLRLRDTRRSSFGPQTGR